MPEVNYLRHIGEKYPMSKNLRQTIHKFLNLNSHEELINFAKEIGIEENIEDIPNDQLKEKIAYELVERYFLERNNQYKKETLTDILNKHQ